MAAQQPYNAAVDFLDRNRQGMSSTFLTRLRIGEILVDAKRGAATSLRCAIRSGR